MPIQYIYIYINIYPQIYIHNMYIYDIQKKSGAFQLRFSDFHFALIILDERLGV